MSFRTDKIRGAHPITPKKGIKETDLNIKEKGMNDRITVSIKPKGVKNRYNPNGYTEKYHLGDIVSHSYGRGKIRHIRYEDNQAHYKINGKYVPESSIIGKEVGFSRRQIKEIENNLHSKVKGIIDAEDAGQLIELQNGERWFIFKNHEDAKHAEKNIVLIDGVRHKLTDKKYDRTEIGYDIIAYNFGNAMF